VQIRITGRLADCIELENRITERFKIDQAIIVPTPPDPSLIRHVIGAAAGGALAERLKDGMAVGVGWGRTLRLSLKSIAVRPVAGLSVVSLLGGLTRGSVLNVYEIASRLAELFSAECFYVAAPVFTDTEETRDLLIRQPILDDAFAHARKVDIAFVSVGALDLEATNFRLGLVNEADLLSLKAAGAVGDVCAHWIDANGKAVDHPLNRRVIALSPEDLRPIETVIVASGGMDKVPALRGTLRLGVVDVLVTDEKAAAGILREE
jgi:DNA-binding transcriptional regulator LsrR (DeoR family)